MNRHLLRSLCLLGLSTSLSWLALAQTPEERADALIHKMTLDEKIQQLHGQESSAHERIVSGIPRLGIPALSMANGPAGIGPTDVVQPHATAFPAPLAVAASWDRKDARIYGASVADEVLSIGRSMLEAPSVNICRIPVSGRTFEAYGEDPFLTAEMAVANINGIQSMHVLGNVKHFALNNQEGNRLTVDAEANERTMREIYFPAFEAAVKRAHVASLMCAYNKVNGDYACQNRFLLDHVLRRDWGFDGFVVSDFGAAHDAVADAAAGLDLEMPKGDTYNKKFLDAVRNGTVPESRIDELLRHRYATMIRMGLFEQSLREHPLAEAEHGQIARNLAADGIVLLRNQNKLLPLDPSAHLKIALLGPALDDLLEGGGAAFVLPMHTITPEAGMKARFGAAQIRVVKVGGAGMIDPRETIDGLSLTPSGAANGAQGVHAEYFDNMGFKGKPVFVRDERVPEMRTEFGAPFATMPPQFSLRWTATLQVPATGMYTLGFEMWGKMRLWLDDRLILDLSNGPNSLQSRSQSIPLEAGHRYALRAEYISTKRGLARLFWTLPQNVETPSLAKAVEAAKDSDVAVVFAGKWAHEGFDATTLALTDQQNRLIEAVARVNPRTIVVLQSGTPVLMPWLNQVAAVVEAWYPGEEGGAAISALLAGDYNPAGKLPITFPANDNQVPANSADRYPGLHDVEHYTEGLEVGYRWQNAHHSTPLFPFGFGLSYTEFSFSGLQLKKQRNGSVDVSLAVKNAGTRDGAEVVQLYMDYPKAAGEPPMQLRGFDKVFLHAGESQTLTLHLDPRAFAIWSAESHGWRVMAGQYKLAVGNSSRFLPLVATVQQSEQLLETAKVH